MNARNQKDKQNKESFWHSRLDIAVERISELKDMSIKISQTNMYREKKNENKKDRICRNCGEITKGVTYV